MESVDAAVVEWIQKNVLDEELIASTLDELRNRLATRVETAANDRPEIETQVVSVKAELERLSNALLGADEKPEAVLRMIAEREKRLVELEARLANGRKSSMTSATDFATIAAAARERLRDLQRLFSRHLEAAHRVIEALLGGPLTFTPKENRYHIAGQVGARWMELVEGAACS